MLEINSHLEKKKQNKGIFVVVCIVLGLNICKGTARFIEFQNSPRISPNSPQFWRNKSF